MITTKLYDKMPFRSEPSIVDQLSFARHLVVMFGGAFVVMAAILLLSVATYWGAPTSLGMLNFVIGFILGTGATAVLAAAIATCLAIVDVVRYQAELRHVRALQETF